MKIKGATDEIQRQKDIQSIVKNVTDETTKSQQAQAKALSGSTDAYKNLTKAQKDYIAQVKQDVLREGYVKTLVREGISVDKANMFADAQISANGPNAFKTPLPNDVLMAARENFNLKTTLLAKMS